MKDSEFNSLSAEKLFEGFKHSVKNAKDHYDAALKLQDSKHFGIANSLLILSAEEAIKSILFLVKIMSPDEEFEVESIFKDHINKHKTASIIHKSSRHFVEVMNNTLETIAQNQEAFIDATPETIIKLTSEISQSNLKIKKQSDDPAELKKEKKWWNKANYKKNIGLYVGFHEDNWVLPSCITHQDFLESKTMIENVLVPMLTLDQLPFEVILLLRGAYQYMDEGND